MEEQTKQEESKKHRMYNLLNYKDIWLHDPSKGKTLFTFSLPLHQTGMEQNEYLAMKTYELIWIDCFNVDVIESVN